ncbi:MAG: hydantoinase B/oxoprolinase family protein, partial [Lautropia sp.]
TLACTARQVRERSAQQSCKPRDLFICNSPFLGGVTLDVVTMLVPVPAADGTAGLAGLAVRYADFGAMARGAFALRRETRHEGFCLPLLRLEFEREPLPEILTAMIGGNVRRPDQAVRGLEAQALAVRRAAGELAASEVPLADRAVARMADAIAGFPPGRFPGRAALAPADRETSAHVIAEVEVAGGRVRVRLAVTDPDALGDDCHSSLAATRAGVVSALAAASGMPAWALSAVTDVETGGDRRLDAAYPDAVAGGAILSFACHQAVAAAMQASGMPVRDHPTLDRFSGTAT